MTRALRFTLAIALGFLFLFRSAQAAEASKTYVLLVGVGSFTDKAINARPASENDAKAMYDLLTNKSYLGAAPENVKLLLGAEDKERKSEPATKENILKYVRWITEKAQKGDLVVIGFYGRGAPLGDRTCYLAAGAVIKDRAKTAVAGAELEQEFKKFKSQKLLAIVDVDYTGTTLDKSTETEPNVLDMVRAFVGDEDKEDHQMPPGRTICLASAELVKHLEVDSNSLFTKCMLDALKGAADVEGGEPDGLVVVDELKKYLEKEVLATARKIGKTREEKEQTASIWGSRQSHFAITRNPAVSAKVDERLQKFEKLDLAAEIKSEGKRLLSRMPSLKAQRELRKEYQKLADGSLSLDSFRASRAKLVEQMKLDAEDAESFARKAIAGIEQVQRIYVKEMVKGEMVAWAIKGMYRELEEPIPDEIAKQLESAKELKRSTMMDLLEKARMHLGKREDLENNKDVTIVMRSMMEGNLDPYSTYYSKEDIREMESQMSGRFTGIGVQIRRDLVRDGLLVVTPIKGSPAYNAKMLAGDLITEIIREVDEEGKKLNPPEVLSTQGMSTKEAVRKILGKAGTKVKIKVVREGVEKPIEFDLTRARVDVETVFGVSRNKDDSWDYYIDKEKKIAYIRLTQFAPRSYEDMRQAVERLNKDGIKGLILDIRFNPGGHLHPAVQISDLFIDDGLIVSIRPRSGVADEEPYGGKSEGSFLNFPMVCMVNGMSASGSEILSACLQDHGRAVILGERSYGKGSVQNIMDFFPAEAKIKLTWATFWRPNGKNLNKLSTSGKEDEDWGVRPDPGFNIPTTVADRAVLFKHLRDNEIIPRRDIPSKDTKVESFKDKQLDAALEYLRNQIKTASGGPAKKDG